MPSDKVWLVCLTPPWRRHESGVFLDFGEKGQNAVLVDRAWGEAIARMRKRSLKAIDAGTLGIGIGDTTLSDAGVDDVFRKISREKWEKRILAELLTKFMGESEYLHLLDEVLTHLSVEMKVKLVESVCQIYGASTILPFLPEADVKKFKWTSMTVLNSEALKNMKEELTSLRAEVAELRSRDNIKPKKIGRKPRVHHPVNAGK